MAEHEKEFVEYVVKALVEKPDSVQVQRSLDQKGVFLELTVDPEDVGKVIGKKGATINAIRALLRVLGAKYDARYSLKVVEPDGYRKSNETQQEVETTSGEQPAVDIEQEKQDQEVEDIKSKAREGLEDLDDLEV